MFIRITSKNTSMTAKIKPVEGESYLDVMNQFIAVASDGDFRDFDRFYSEFKESTFEIDGIEMNHTEFINYCWELN